MDQETMEAFKVGATTKFEDGVNLGSQDESFGVLITNEETLNVHDVYRRPST
jgi:hypothetical protein